MPPLKSSESLPLPFWLDRLYAVRGGSLKERQAFCLEAWLRFLEISEQLDLSIEERLQTLGGPGRRSYFRWKRMARDGRPFQIPRRMELLCSVVGCLEAIQTGSSLGDAKVNPRDALGRPPFVRDSPLKVLRRARVVSNRALWMVLQYPAEGPKLVARMRAEPLFFLSATF